MKHQVSGEIISNQEVSPGTHLIWVDAPDIAGEGQPGQFVMVDCPSADGLVLRRPMTIFRFGRDLRADSLPKTSFSMLFNVVGKGRHGSPAAAEGKSSM